MSLAAAIPHRALPLIEGLMISPFLEVGLGAAGEKDAPCDAAPTVLTF
jgi:hypothetical protein